MKPTVVILLSDKRSGSTMFERELCKHPDINHVTYTPHSYNETHHWNKAACLLEQGSRASTDSNCRGYGSKTGARQYLIDCIVGNIPNFTASQNDEGLVYDGWKALCQKFAKPVFFEKSPQLIHNLCALELLLKWHEKTEFNVRFIGLVRNPMAVMYSAQKLFGTDPVERQHGWADSCSNLDKFEERIGSEKFLLVKYEDLVDEPVRAFGEICSFIGVNPVGEIGKDVHSRSADAWKSAKNFTLHLDEKVAAVAKAYGYSDEELANPDKPVPSVFQEFWHGMVNKSRLARSRMVDWYLKPLYLRFIKRK
ncbi:MAG: sulfotransferase family protein [Arenicellales bacterium]